MTDARQLAERILREMGPWDYAVFKEKLPIIESLISEALEEKLKKTYSQAFIHARREAKAEAYEKAAQATKCGYCLQAIRALARREGA